MGNQSDVGQAQDRLNLIKVIWNPACSLGKAGGSPIALRVGKSEVNWKKRASVSYYIYSFAYHKLIPIQMKCE